ncbi:MAG: glycosyltransferase, partial [Solirubrobacteraceae bacterium]
MILFLHHRYRTTGGEEQAVDDLVWLVRTHLGEDAELLERDSAQVGKTRAAAGLVRGGLEPSEVARAVRRTGARIVHAHNLHPTLGWRALAAAREAGARVVLHLHQYRLVCAIGVCFRDGHECLRCHGRNTLPGIALNCRGSRIEAAAYGVALMSWQRRLAAQADVFVVPSHFAQARLRAIGAPLGPTFVLPHVIREFAPAPPSPPGDHALVVSRLAPEKGVDVAIEACRLAGMPLVVAGDGPERERLARADGAVRFLGRVSPQDLVRLRGGARMALVPSLSAETFGLAAAEAMASGLPVATSRVGALPELVP